MLLTDAETKALRSSSVRSAAFVRIATNPMLRLWSGVGDIAAQFVPLDPAGTVFRGIGELVGVPELQQLINGAAARIEFTLSGVSEHVLAVAAGEAAAVQGRTVHVGEAFFDDAWQLLGPVHLMWRGIADQLSIQQAPSTGIERPIVRTVTLSAGSMLTGRRRPGLSYFTDQDQQRRSSGDRFCERVSLYQQGVEKGWPRFDDPPEE